MDETLAAIVRGAEADPNILAVFLHGSRAVGHERPDSDYDVWFVMAVDGAVAEIPNVDAASVTIDQLRKAEARGGPTDLSRGTCSSTEPTASSSRSWRDSRLRRMPSARTTAI